MPIIPIMAKNVAATDFLLGTSFSKMYAKGIKIRGLVETIAMLSPLVIVPVSYTHLTLPTSDLV